MNDIEQRTESWFAIRCGKVTASRVADLMAKTKSGYAASRDNYMAQLVCERITGKPAESYSNAAMQWGTEQEPFARAAYEAHTGVIVEETGFHSHPTIEAAGASPDGLVYESKDPVRRGRLVEFKAPVTREIIPNSIPSAYLAQMQLQLQVTGLDVCDFVEASFAGPYGSRPITEGPGWYSGYIAVVQREELVDGQGRYYVYSPLHAIDWVPTLERETDVVVEIQELNYL